MDWNFKNLYFFIFYFKILPKELFKKDLNGGGRENEETLKYERFTIGDSFFVSWPSRPHSFERRPSPGPF